MWRASEAAAAVGATRTGPDVTFDGVSTDSRALTSGGLFVALRGANFDGHDFAARALAQGAAAVLLDRDGAPGVEAGAPDGAAVLRVADTRAALGRLAAAWRARFAVRVAAVTGSNGKTTVKEMLAGVLRAHAMDAAVLATAGNLNNDIGLPLTLLRLREGHRYAVLEMGMNAPGEIAVLTRLARPDCALINNAQAAHLQGLGTVAEVARAKGEIFEGLAPGGVAVINADDPYAGFWRGLAAGHPVLSFGLGPAADVRALTADGTDFSPGAAPDGRAPFTLRTPAGAVELRLAVPGAHNVRNALAAAAAAHALGVGLAATRAGLAAFAGVPGRLQSRPGLNGATFLDDTYNANPGSVAAALAVLAQAAGPKILVLGDMGELGEGGAGLHAEIGRQAAAAGVDALYALGELTGHAVTAFGPGAVHYKRLQELLADLENRLAPGVTVLVKGSRFMRMERVVQSFTLSQEE